MTKTAKSQGRATQAHKPQEAKMTLEDIAQALEQAPRGNAGGIIGQAMTLIDKGNHELASTAKIRDGLTHKQDQFARLVAAGASQSEAYRQAYDVSPNASPATIHAQASLVAANHKVIARVKYYIDHTIANSQHDPMAIRVVVLNTLLEICQRSTAKDSDRNRSAELLGKVRGEDLFKDADPNQTAANVQTMTDLSNRLRAFIDARTPQPIEGQAVSVSDTEDNDQSEPSGIDNSPEPETPSS